MPTDARCGRWKRCRETPDAAVELASGLARQTQRLASCYTDVMALHSDEPGAPPDSRHASEVRETAQTLLVLLAIGAGLICAIALSSYLVLFD